MVVTLLPSGLMARILSAQANHEQPAVFMKGSAVYLDVLV